MRRVLVVTAALPAAVVSGAAVAMVVALTAGGPDADPVVPLPPRIVDGAGTDGGGASGAGGYDTACPSGYRVGGAPPFYVAEPGQPMGDPTADVALARAERLVRRTVSGVNGTDAHLIAGRRVTKAADRADVVLVGPDGRPLARADVERAEDGSWTLAGSWACASY